MDAYANRLCSTLAQQTVKLPDEKTPIPEVAPNSRAAAAADRSSIDSNMGHKPVRDRVEERKKAAKERRKKEIDDYNKYQAAVAEQMAAQPPQ